MSTRFDQLCANRQRYEFCQVAANLPEYGDFSYNLDQKRLKDESKYWYLKPQPLDLKERPGKQMSLISIIQVR